MRLDFEAGYDLADLGGLSIAVVETGGNTFAAAVATGKRFLTKDASSATGDYASKVTSYTPALITSIQSALNGGTGSGAYTVTFSTTTQRVTVAHNGVGGITAVSLTPTTNGGLLGLTAVKSGALSHEFQRTPDYWIGSAIGFWSEWSGEYEGGEDPGVDVEAHDGAPAGIARDGTATYLDLVVPTEPVAVVGNYPRLIAAAQPWTWADLFRYCRNVNPIAMTDDDETYFLRLRAEGARFKPQRLGSNYYAYWDIPIQARVLARM